MPSPATDGIYAVETRAGWKVLELNHGQWRDEDGLSFSKEIAQWVGPFPERVLFRDKDDPSKWT